MIENDSQDTLPALLKTRIQDWLREDGWGVMESPSDNLSWRLSAEEAGRQVGVYMRPDRVDEVILEAVVEIGDMYQAELNSMSEQDRMDVLLDLAMELTGREFEMGGFQNPVERVSIRKSVYYDGISKDLFMQRANSLKLGAAFIQSFIQRRLRPQPALSGSQRLQA